MVQLQVILSVHFMNGTMSKERIFRWSCFHLKGEMFNRFTDDSVMTFAVAEILKEYLENEKKIDSSEIVRVMQKWGRKYPNAGYGGTFVRWLAVENPQPYGSWGNGALMRISPVGLCEKLTLEEKFSLSEKITCVSHNAKEAVESVNCYIEILDLLRSLICKAGGFESLNHRSVKQNCHSVTQDCHSEFISESVKQKVLSICEKYNVMVPELDKIRPSYEFDVSCQGTLPVAIAAFLESETFEDSIRNAISVGGDSDTIAAITGGIAEAFYGKEKVLEFLKKPLSFEKDFGVLGAKPLGEGEAENRRFAARGSLSPLDFMKESDCDFVKRAAELNEKI